MLLRSKALTGLMILGILISFSASLIIGTAKDTQSSEPVVVFSLSGQITGVTTSTIQELVSTGEILNARLIVIEISTIGGELGAITNIMQLFADSSIPIMLFIKPAELGISGGTYLLQAAHIATMGFASQIGACQPIGGLDPITDAQYLNDMVTLITSYAGVFERNTTTASRFITENLVLGPTDALALGSVEFVDGSVADLLNTLEAYTLIQRELQPSEVTYKLVPTADLASYTYTQVIEDFAGVTVETQYRYTPTVGLTLLSFLAYPPVSFLLLQIGIWGFIFALNAPGHLGEVLGIICIVLGVVGFGVIGISVAAIVLMVLGVILLLIEAKTDIAFAGLAGGIGIACFALGGIFFLPPSRWLVPLQVMWFFQGLSATFALVFSAVFGYAVIKAAQARRLMSDFDPRLIPGTPGIAETLLDPEGHVRAFGERWMAIAQKGVIKAGESIEVIRLDGIRLIVKRVEPPPEE